MGAVVIPAADGLGTDWLHHLRIARRANKKFLRGPLCGGEHGVIPRHLEEFEHTARVALEILHEAFVAQLEGVSPQQRLLRMPEIEGLAIRRREHGYALAQEDEIRLTELLHEAAQDHV